MKKISEYKSTVDTKQTVDTNLVKVIQSSMQISMHARGRFIGNLDSVLQDALSETYKIQRFTSIFSASINMQNSNQHFIRNTMFDAAIN